MLYAQVQELFIYHDCFILRHRNELYLFLLLISFYFDLLLFKFYLKIISAKRSHYSGFSLRVGKVIYFHETCETRLNCFSFIFVADY